MNIRPLHITFTCLLLIACSFAASCSTEPTVQAEKVASQQVKDIPKPLADVVVASEAEVLTWDESADQTKSPSENTDSDK